MDLDLAKTRPHSLHDRSPRARHDVIVQSNIAPHR
jgi:hypothetical protein